MRDKFGKGMTRGDMDWLNYIMKKCIDVSDDYGSFVENVKEAILQDSNSSSSVRRLVIIPTSWLLSELQTFYDCNKHDEELSSSNLITAKLPINSSMRIGYACRLCGNILHQKDEVICDSCCEKLRSLMSLNS